MVVFWQEVGGVSLRSRDENSLSECGRSLVTNAVKRRLDHHHGAIPDVVTDEEPTNK